MPLIIIKGGGGGSGGSGPANTDQLPEGAANKYFTAGRAIASALTGYAKAAAGRALVATDTIRNAFGVLEKRAEEIISSVGTLNNLTTAQKGNLVDAVNEVKTLAENAGGGVPEDFVLQETGQSTTQVMSQKTVTDALTNGIFTVCFPNTNREYLDTFKSNSRITAIELKEGVATFSYSLSGGAFVTPALPLTADIVIPAGQVIKYRITHTPGAVLGLISINYKHD